MGLGYVFLGYNYWILFIRRCLVLSLRLVVSYLGIGMWDIFVNGGSISIMGFMFLFLLGLGLDLGAGLVVERVNFFWGFER